MRKVVHVTGTSGAGKSEMSRRLRALGYRTISTDGTDGLCGWVDVAGTPVWRPAHPSGEWLRVHRWVWDLDRLDEVLSAYPDGALFVCGNAANDDDAADRFDVVVLLDIDEATMIARVLDPARGNDFGRRGEELAWLVEERQVTRERYLRRGAVAVDATAPLDDVAAAVVRASSVQSGGCVETDDA